jgi:hypothetical protein
MCTHNGLGSVVTARFERCHFVANDVATGLELAVRQHLSVQKRVFMIMMHLPNDLLDQRQLLLPVDDSYFCRSAPT